MKIKIDVRHNLKETDEFSDVIWMAECLTVLRVSGSHQSLDLIFDDSELFGETIPLSRKQDFGPMIIGVLVAALADCITAEDWMLVNDGKGEDVYSGQPLMSWREEYYSPRLLLCSACS